MSDLYNERQVKATRKPHRCAYCGKEIQTGSSALYEWGIADGFPFSRYACSTCIPLLDDFWRYTVCDIEDIREAFDGYLEVYEEEKSKTKVCTKCGKQLPLHSFERHNIGYWAWNDMFSDTCKECVSRRYQERDSYFMGERNDER